MCRFPLVLSVGLLVSAVAASLPAIVRAGDAPKPDLPQPPTTPLPKFANPLHDAEVGETCFYVVHEAGKNKPDEGWSMYFEERVLARTATRVLVETIKTDETDTKEYPIDNTATGWRDAAETVTLPDGWHFLPEKDKEEIVYVGKPGSPPTKAVRATHRFIEYPEDMNKPDAAKKVRQVWYSHDVLAQGRAKQFPAQREGERIALSWDKKLSLDECKRRAADYPDTDAKPTAPPATPPAAPPAEPGMGGDGMSEPAMN
jgi:hypothetical protein